MKKSNSLTWLWTCSSLFLYIKQAEPRWAFLTLLNLDFLSAKYPSQTFPPTLTIRHESEPWHIITRWSLRSNYAGLVYGLSTHNCRVVSSLLNISFQPDLHFPAQMRMTRLTFPPSLSLKEQSSDSVCFRFLKLVFSWDRSWSVTANAEQLVFQMWTYHQLQWTAGIPQTSALQCFRAESKRAGPQVQAGTSHPGARDD